MSNDEALIRMRCIEVAHKVASAQALRNPQEIVAIANVLCDYVLNGFGGCTVSENQATEKQGKKGTKAKTKTQSDNQDFMS